MALTKSYLTGQHLKSSPESFGESKNFAISINLTTFISLLLLRRSVHPPPALDGSITGLYSFIHYATATAYVAVGLRHYQSLDHIRLLLP
jgi:hypothetical protein